MRLALCLEYPLHQRGGVEVLLGVLIEELHRDHELHLVSADPMETIQASLHGPMLRSHFRWIPSDFSAGQIQRLTAWAKEYRIELFHFHLGGTHAWNARSWNRCAITELASAGFRCLTTNHQAISPFDANRLDQPLARRLASFLIRWPGKARQLSAVEREIHVSKHDLRIARASFPFHRHKLDQIYHSQLDVSQPAAPWSKDSRIVLNLATLAFRKGQHILAEAFARIAGDFPDWQLQLIGYEGEAACVERIRHIAHAKRLTHRIHMPGTTDQPAAAIADAGIYVQPSLLEGLGLSLQEAMFHGRPCIGSEVGGIPELIDHERSGLLVPPGDPAALASALARLMADADERARLAHAARQDILHKHMTRQDMVHAHLEMYARQGRDR